MSRLLPCLVPLRELDGLRLQIAPEFLGQRNILNNMTYDVYLCRNYSGVWWDIKHGHHFDLHTKKISKLKIVPTNLLI